jgi:WD40 repeat protein|eukprot:CAMPEP_0174321188 /NCGR_PEP_ID=MMETSP0810-20121108/10099_1 /TAXON_ID=73025 ORGANISM="Eutreptiella gymnastica-like, Strain CCMP1594" /NCGR_SAMPLE_ID=MMETSP0810 /ASSEMBLY_ACC=CAM_ASM_000659 /LENGTH=449 /DNA_ID=CAMNT_0015432449 /DNA_START=51 /DNA_END=1400 /DNA_ORIENTATION=+
MTSEAASTPEAPNNDAKFKGANVPVKFFTNTFDQHMQKTTFHMPVKVTLEALSEFVNVTLGLTEQVRFNFLHNDQFIRYTTLEKWIKKKGITKESTIELEYTPAFEIEAGNNLPHDDWVSVIRRLPVPADGSGDATQHPYLTGSYDHCWRIWKGDDCLHVGAGHTSAIKCASIINASESEITSGKRKRNGVDCKFVTGSSDGNVLLWQYQGGKARELYKFVHSEAVECVAVHGTGSLLATGGWNKLLRVWTLDRLEEDMAAGHVGKQQYMHCGLAGHSRTILGCEWSKEKRSRLFSTGMDGNVRVWDIIAQGPVMTLSADASAAYCIATRQVSGGDSIITGHTDNKLRLWDTRSPSRCGTYAAHTGFVHSVTWNAIPGEQSKDTMFTSASEDCNLHVWDIRGGAPLASVNQHADGILCVEWMGDGVLMTGSKDNQVKSCNIKSNAPTAA